MNVGEWVEVRSKEEILRTLDEKGELDDMPFMPEMFAYCGKRFQIHKSAHKTCDTVFPIRARRVDRAVHLATRCDGQAHGGCQAGCLIFWKEAWLKRVDQVVPNDAATPSQAHSSPAKTACTESDVQASTQRPNPDGGAPTYVCQATRLPYFTRDLEWWELRQYVQDYLSGNVGLRRVLDGLLYASYYNLSQMRGLARLPMRRLYDLLSPLWGGPRFPRASGTIHAGSPTPTASLDLQPGEWVRVKPHEQILQTITTDNRNRGMLWDAEMVPFCGGTYRVLKRVTRILDEKTGTMLEMKTPCIVLDAVVCQARYSACRMFCPRSIYPYWREAWLERIDPAAAGERQPRLQTRV